MVFPGVCLRCGCLDGKRNGGNFERDNRYHGLYRKSMSPPLSQSRAVEPLS